MWQLLALLQTAVCRQPMTENLESSKDCLLLLHWGKSAYTFWGVGVGTLGKYVVMKLSKEMECSVICMGGK